MLPGNGCPVSGSRMPACSEKSPRRGGENRARIGLTFGVSEPLGVTEHEQAVRGHRSADGAPELVLLQDVAVADQRRIIRESVRSADYHSVITTAQLRCLLASCRCVTSKLESRVKALTEELGARTGYRRVVAESSEWRQVLKHPTQHARASNGCANRPPPLTAICSAPSVRATFGRTCITG
jgi:hypothetical protein